MLVKLGLNLNLYLNTHFKKPLQSDFPFNVTTFAVLKKVKLMSRTWALSVWISLYMYNNYIKVGSYLLIPYFFFYLHNYNTGFLVA